MSDLFGGDYNSAEFGLGATTTTPAQPLYYPYAGPLTGNYFAHETPFFEYNNPDQKFLPASPTAYVPIAPGNNAIINRLGVAVRPIAVRAVQRRVLHGLADLDFSGLGADVSLDSFSSSVFPTGWTMPLPDPANDSSRQKPAAAEILWSGATNESSPVKNIASNLLSWGKKTPLAVDTGLDMDVVSGKFKASPPNNDLNASSFISTAPLNYGMNAPTVSRSISSPSSSVVRAAVEIGHEIGSTLDKAFSSAPAIQNTVRAQTQRQGVKGPPGGAGGSGSGGSTFDSIINGITQLVAPFAAAKQQKQQAAAQRSQRVAPQREEDNTMTFVYIGGGALVLAGLVYFVAKD